MNLTLPAGGKSFTLLHATGQGPRNPRGLQGRRNVGEKTTAYANVDKVLAVAKLKCVRDATRAALLQKKKVHRADF
jgi:hypothetical protein